MVEHSADGRAVPKRANNIAMNRTRPEYGACAVTQISRPLSNPLRNIPCFHSRCKLGQCIYETDA